MNGFERIREGYKPLSLWYSNGKCLQIFPFKNFLQIWDLDILNNLLQTASYDSLFVWFKQTLHNWSLCGSHWLIFSCTNILHRGQLGKLHCISKSEIILAKKWWWALKMGQWPISHSKTCKFPNFNGPLEIFMGPLQNLMGPRSLKIPIRAHLTWDLNSLYMGPSQKYTSQF